MAEEEDGRWVTINGRATFIPDGAGGGKSGVGRLQKAAGDNPDRKQLKFLRDLLAEGGHSKRDRAIIEKKMEKVSKRIVTKG